MESVSSIEKEEGNSEIVVIGCSTNFNLVRCSTSSSSSSSNNTRNTRLKLDSDLDSLPDELIAKEILIRIPAQDIFDATMTVCRKWYQITHTRKFIYDHLHRSTHGLLIMNANTKEISCLSITPSSAKIQISKMSYKCRYGFWSSCNGLVLETYNLSDSQELVITNPLTKQHFPLPPFIVPNHDPYSASAIAYAPTQKDYKVVRTYFDHPKPRVYCAISTVGVDNAWRFVDSRHLSVTASQLLFMCPLVTEGFVHWAEDFKNNHAFSVNTIVNQMTNNYVLTLDIETEMITHIPAPRSNGAYYYYKYLSSGGSYLSLLIGRGNLKWEVWEMEPNTREWTKLPDIDLEAHKGLLNDSYDREKSLLKPGDGDCLDCKLAPAGWLKYRDVIVFITYRPLKECSFRQARLRVVYNVQTKDISLFSANQNHFHPYLVHRNSLIGLSD